MNNKIAVFLPIKKHSERIREKNFVLVGDKPLHNVLIDKLENADFVNKIYINTDSIRIMEYYKNNPRVKLIEREKKVIGDSVSMNDVIKSSLRMIDEEVMLQTHSTNPLVLVETFEKAVKTYFEQIENGCDSLMTVNKYYKRFYDNDFRAINHDPKVLLQTQNLSPLLVENSCIYLFSKSIFEKTNSRVGNKPFLLEMNEYEAIDIDWPEDLEIVRKLIVR